MQTRRFIHIFTPSVISGLTAVLASIAVFAGATFSYVIGKGLIYDYLFGENSSAELIQQSKGTISVFSNTVLGNPILNKVLYFVFWMLVGLLVYVVMSIVIRGASAAAEEVQESTYKNSIGSERLKELGLRTAVRAIAALAWVMYWIIFVQIITPFAVLCAKIGTGQFPDFTGWLYGVLGLTVLTLSIHLHLSFIRLIALRVRLLGATADEVD